MGRISFRSHQFLIAFTLRDRKVFAMNQLARSATSTAFLLALTASPFSAMLEARSGSDTALGALVPQGQGFTAGAGLTHAFASELSYLPADISVTRFPVRLSYDVPGGPQGFLSLNALYEYSEYDWGGLPLFDSAHRVALSGVGLRRMGDSDWGIFGFGQVAWSAEDGMNLFHRSLSATVIAGPAYSFTRNFSLVVGGLASVQPERDPRFFPIAALNWRINDEWLLRTLNGAILSCTPADQDRYQFDVSAEYRTRSIRLRPMPGFFAGRDPAVREKEIAVGAGASIRLTDRLAIQTFAEYLFAREWEFRWREAHIGSLEAGNTLQAGFRLDYLF